MKIWNGVGKRFCAAVLVVVTGGTFAGWNAAGPQTPPPLFSVTGRVEACSVLAIAESAGGVRTLPSGAAVPKSSQAFSASEHIADLARSLDYDWRRCFLFVRDHVAYAPYFGFLRGAERTFLDLEGNDGDQSLLLLELLRACGHSDATLMYVPCDDGVGFVVPLYSHEGQLPYNAASWFGLDESNGIDFVLNEVWTRLLGMMCPIVYFYDAETERHYIKTSRFWVSLPIGGTILNLDPAFKPCRRRPQRDFAQDMGLESVENLSATNLEVYLDGYCAVLHSVWTNANTTASDYVGDSQIDDMANEYPYFPGTVAVGSPQDFSFFPEAEQNSFRAEVSVRLDESSTAFFLDEIGARMLWISYEGETSAPHAVLRLGETVILEEALPSAGALNLHIDVSYTNACTNTFNSASTSADYTLQRSVSNAFVIAVGFGADDLAVRRLAAESVAEADVQGIATNSPAFIARTARFAGQNWIAQCSMLGRLASRRIHGFSREFYSLGVSGGGTAPYVDMKNSFSGFYAATNLFPALSFMRSALEHAVLDQIVGTNAPAISTIKALSLAAASGISVHYTDLTNFDSVKTGLSGYSDQQVASLQQWIDAGYTLLLPNSPVQLNAWSGIAFAAMLLPPNGTWRVFMMIDGGLAGGCCSIPYSVTTERNATASVSMVKDQPPYAEAHTADPVTLPALALCDAETDLSLRGGSSLSWVRNYDSRSRNTVGSMGRGWTHAFEVSVRETADPDAAFGGGPSDAVIPTAVALTVIESLMAQDSALLDGELARRRLLAALTTDWWTRRMTASAAAVTLGSKALLFHRRQNGSYDPPPGVTATLSRTDGGWMLAERNGNSYAFDASGRLSSISDISGNMTSLAHSDDGKLLSVSNGFGRSFALSWDGSHIASVADNAGHSVSYAYDTDGCLTNVTDAAGKNWRMAYDQATGALVSRFDPDGTETLHNAYSTFGQVTNQISSSGGVWRFGAAAYMAAWDEDPLGNRMAQTFDASGRVLSRTARDGGTTAFAYDGHGHLVTNIDAAGCHRVAAYDGRDNLIRIEEGTGTTVRVTSFAYDAADRLAAVTNALGGVTAFSYDGCGRTVRTLFADGTSITNAWTEHGLLSSQTRLDASGGAVLRILFAYGADGLPVSRTTVGAGLPPDGIVESFAWDTAGNLISRTDGEGRSETFGYDTCGRLVSRTDALGGVAAYAYSGSGFLTNVTDAAGRSTALRRTPSGNIAAVVFPDGTVSTNIYDAADRLVSAIDVRGFAVSFARDAEGRIVSCASAAGNATITYSLLGLPVAATNAAGEAAAFAYDAFGNPMSRTDGLGAAWETEHDILGRLAATHDPIGRARTFEHDSMGRLVSATRPSGVTDGFGYNTAGQLVSYTNAAGNVHTLVRDSLGRVLSETDGEGRTLYTAAYDRCGNMTNFIRGTDASGGSSSSVPVRLSYDALNRLISRTADGIDDRFSWSATGELLSASNSVAAEIFSYDVCGRLASAETRIDTNAYATACLRDAGGLVTNISYSAGFSVSREYDSDGRLVVVRDGLGHEWTFAYDGEGKPLGGTSPDGRAHTFAYDAAGRLSSWSVVGIAGRAIGRDAAGRRIRDTATAGAMPHPRRERRAQNAFDRAGRIVSAEVECGTNAPIHEVYLHDASGAVTNATADGECVFSAQYDALGQLMSLGGPPSAAAAFSSDALGNRIRIGDRIFIPDHDDPLKRPLLECDENGAPLRAYIWGAGRLLGFIDMGGAGFVPTAFTVAHCDEQGSVIALTSADGTILHTAHYGPHGEDWGASGENPTPFAWLGGWGCQVTVPG